MHYYPSPHLPSGRPPRTFYSGIELVEPDDDNRPLLVGERTNVIGSAKDAVNMAGFVASNLLNGDMPAVHADSIPEGMIIDVRMKKEHEKGAIRQIALDCEIKVGLIAMARDQITDIDTLI